MGESELVPPRVMLVPECSYSRGPEAVAFAAEHGVHLDPWQQLVMEGGCGVNEDGTWSAFETAMLVGRQNGKSEALLARCLAGVFLWGERLVIWSAHQRDTALEMHRRLLHLIEENSDLDSEVKRVIRSHGEEGVELRDGSRVRFRTRTGKSARGYSCDLLVVDEGHFCDYEAMGALTPTLSARKTSQIWVAGSAVDQFANENGLVMARLRERGHRGDSERLAYYEWSPHLVDAEGVELSLDDLYDELVNDVEVWRQANPALGIRVSAAHVKVERESMHPRTWACERLCIGSWPALDVVSTSPISAQDWLELVDADSELIDPVVIAFDVSPDRRASIAAAGRRPDGLLHCEVIRAQPGTQWLVDELVRLEEKHSPEAVVADGYGPGGSVISAVEAAGVNVTNVTAREHADACSRLLDLVGQKALRHRGASEVVNALRGATPRPLGDAWAWSRKNSSVDVSPLVACTLAAWRAAELPVGTDDEVRIY